MLQKRKGFTVIPLSVTVVYLLTFISLIIENKKQIIINKSQLNKNIGIGKL